MMIVLALLYGISILMTGSSFAAIHGRFAQQLEIPGTAAIPYVHWITLGAYVLAVMAISRIKKTWIRWCSFIGVALVANVLVAYPVLLLNRGSKVITVEDPITREDLASFKSRFPVLVSSYSASNEGHIIRVRTDQYSQDMPEYLNQLQKKKPNKSDMATPRKPSD